jgi:hypothetical protein
VAKNQEVKKMFENIIKWIKHGTTKETSVEIGTKPAVKETRMIMPYLGSSLRSSKKRGNGLNLDEIEKVAKEWGYPSLAELCEDCRKSGDGFRERFERICGILLGKSPKERDEKYSP